MQIAPFPPNEDARVAALHSLGVLDTPPEERFDRITRLASLVFDVPIAFVSLLDRNRQWFKSKVGMELCETPRDISFCAHAILEDHILVIPDTSFDPRFSDNPFVTGEPFVRFYAGIPLRASGGEAVGTLCLIDFIARKFERRENEILRNLAGMAEDELRVRPRAAGG